MIRGARYWVAAHASAWPRLGWGLPLLLGSHEQGHPGGRDLARSDERNSRAPLA